MTNLERVDWTKFNPIPITSLDKINSYILARGGVKAFYIGKPSLMKQQELWVDIFPHLKNAIRMRQSHDFSLQEPFIASLDPYPGNTTVTKLFPEGFVLGTLYGDGTYQFVQLNGTRNIKNALEIISAHKTADTSITGNYEQFKNGNIDIIILYPWIKIFILLGMSILCTGILTYFIGTIMYK